MKNKDDSLRALLVIFLVTWIAGSQSSISLNAAAMTRVQSAKTVTRTPTDAVITPECLKALVAFALTSTAIFEVPQTMAVPLGLTEPEVPYVTRQISFSTEGAKHVLALKKAGDSDKILTFAVKNDGVDLWVLNMQGKLVSAGRLDLRPPKENRQFQTLTVEETTKSFEAEMRLWTGRDICTPPKVQP